MTRRHGHPVGCDETMGHGARPWYGTLLMGGETDCPVCKGTGEGPRGYFPNSGQPYCWACAATGDCDPEATPEQMAEARLAYERIAREPSS